MWGFSPQSLYSVSLSSWIFQFGQEKFHLGSAHLGGFSTDMVPRIKLRTGNGRKIYLEQFLMSFKLLYSMQKGRLLL